MYKWLINKIYEDIIMTNDFTVVIIYIIKLGSHTHYLEDENVFFWGLEFHAKF